VKVFVKGSRARGARQGSHPFANRLGFDVWWIQQERRDAAGSSTHNPDVSGRRPWRTRSCIAWIHSSHLPAPSSPACACWPHSQVRF